MRRPFAAALRRLRPAAMAKATRSIQSAMTGFLLSSALAPLTAMTRDRASPGKTGTSKTATGKSKTAVPKPGRAKVGQSLGSVLKQLRVVQTEGRMPKPAAAPAGRAGAVAVPKGAQYLSRIHRSTAGSRGYTLFLPSQPARPNGLILMLHGCKQSPDDFARGTRMNALAEKHGLAIAYPDQTSAHNAAACWNWFQTGHQARGAGEPAILASLARKLAKDYALGREAVFVAGLSAGGAMAAILADVYPDVFSAAGVHSGLARGSARDVMSAMSAMRSGGSGAGKPELPDAVRRAAPVRRIIFHGSADSTVHPANAGAIVASALGHDAGPVRLIARLVQGRSYSRSDYAGPKGMILAELWMIDGAGHAWSGGHATGSYTDATGPDASAQMVRFFLDRPT
jgi:poly(hydroxyalkanoate) depolymerase family esterase